MGSVRDKQNRALVRTRFARLSDQYETQVRDVDGSVSIGVVDIVVTKPKADQVAVFGVDLRNEECLNLTLSLVALGYRPRMGGTFMLNGDEWRIRSIPHYTDNVVKITVSRSTS